MKNVCFSKSVFLNPYYGFFLVLLFVLLLPSYLFSQISHTTNFSVSEFTLTSKTAADSNVYLHVSMSKLQLLSEVGKPQLPVKYLKFLLPPNTKVKNITINNVIKTAKNIDNKIFPAQLPEPTSINSGKQKFIPPDNNIYNSSNPFPANIIQAEGDSYFDGDNHIVTIAVYPVRYFPLSNKIEFNTVISFSLNLESYVINILVMPKFRTPEDQKIYDNILKAIVDNPEDIPKYQTKPPTMNKISTTQNLSTIQNAVPFYKYIIITTNSFKNSFKQFVDWKKRKGINIGVVTIEDILDNYTAGDLISNINDAAGNLRQYLRDAYESGVTMYTLLADSLLPNNQHSIPIRYGNGNENYTDNDDNIPTDLYFSNLTANWNVDGDTFYGEISDGNAIYSPNIFIGKLHFANSTEVANWTQKEIEYEQNPFNGNYSAVTRNLWSISDDMQNENQDTQVEAYIPASISETFLRELPGPYAAITTAPTGTDIINAINTGYGFYNIYNHGTPTEYDVSNSGNNQRPWKGVTRLRTDTPPYEEWNSFDNITANNTSTIVYSISCNVAQPDYTIRSLGDIYTTLGNSGGTAFLGNTRAGWVDYSYLLHEKFVQALYNDNIYNLGQAEAFSIYNYSGGLRHYLALTHNLYGDPEMPVWTATPSQFSNLTVTDNGNSITVNTGVSGSTICVSSLDNGNSYYLSVNALSYSFSTSVRPLP